MKMEKTGRYDIIDARLKTPFSMIIAGPSNSGKTSYVNNLLKHSERLIDKKFDYILWFYGQSPPFQRKGEKMEHINFIDGLPASFDDLIQPHLNGLAIFDDLMSECSDNPLVSELFTRRSHHENLSIIFITQIFFSEGKERKTFTKNATYLVIFNSPLDQTISHSLARKLMPKQVKTFHDIFTAATNTAHGYLFIDGHQKRHKDVMFRSQMFNDTQRVYIPTKK